MKIGISACLLGCKYRYDGSDRKNEKLLKLLEDHELIPVCPEYDSGFPIPHEPIELRNGRAFMKNENDVTDQLLNGSMTCLEKISDCDLLILKSKSPSCGYKKIYDGSFSGKLIDGNGMFTDLCLKSSIMIFSDTDIRSIKEYISR